MKKTILIALALIGFVVQAQIDQDNRIEYDEDLANAFEVLTSEGQKTLVVKYSNENKDKKKTYNYIFELLDENMKRIQTVVVERNEKLHQYERAFTDAQFHYLLFFSNKTGAFVHYRIQLSNLDVKKTTGNFGGKFLYYDMCGEQDHIFVSCRVKKKISALSIDLNNGMVTNVDPLLKVPNTKMVFNEIKKVKTSKGHEIFFEYEVIYGKDDKKDAYVRFDEKGSPINELLFAPQPANDYWIKQCTYNKRADGVYMVIGTYSKVRRGTATGIFFAQQEENNLKTINYHEFLDLKNFVNYSTLTEEYIEKKQAKAEKKGKDLVLDFLCIAHDLEEKNGFYYGVIEFYFRTYRTEYETYTDANGRTRTRTRQVFDGYQYTHAVIAKFNNNGEMEWSNAFSLWPYYKPMYLRELVNLIAIEPEIQMAFFDQSRSISVIKFDATGENKGIDKKTFFRYNSGKEKVKYQIGGEVEKWYNNYFVTFGFEKIKSESEDDEGRKKRKVYYVNKLSVE